MVFFFFYINVWHKVILIEVCFIIFYIRKCVNIKLYISLYSYWTFAAPTKILGDGADKNYDLDHCKPLGVQSKLWVLDFDIKVSQASSFDGDKWR